ACAPYPHMDAPILVPADAAAAAAFRRCTNRRGEPMYRTQPQRKALAIAVFAGLVSLASLPAMAQDAPTPPQEEATTLDKLVVPAPEREGDMQDGPIMVTSLARQALPDGGVRDIKDLQPLVPGLTVTSTQSESITAARIRGVGTEGDNVGLESSVGVVV